MSEGTLPIACTLTQEELADRHSELLPGLLSRADSKDTIPGGFRWSFRETRGLLKEGRLGDRGRTRLLSVLEVRSDP